MAWVDAWDLSPVLRVDTTSVDVRTPAAIYSVGREVTKALATART